MGDIDRRGFLRLLSTSAVVLASPTSFFDMGPSAALGAAHGLDFPFLSTDYIIREALKALNNNPTFAQSINRQYEGWERDDVLHLFKKGYIISLKGKFQVNPITTVRDPTGPRDLLIGMEPIDNRLADIKARRLARRL